MKMSKTLIAKFSHENKEILKKKLAKDIKILVKKKKKQQYDRESYKNLSKDQKQKLVEYKNKYYRMIENFQL